MGLASTRFPVEISPELLAEQAPIQDGTGGSYAARLLDVRFAPSTSAERIQQIAEETGYPIISATFLGSAPVLPASYRVRVADGDSIEKLQTAAARLEAVPEVEVAELSSRGVVFHAVDLDGELGQPELQRIRVDEAHMVATGENVSIAIIDSAFVRRGGDRRRFFCDSANIPESRCLGSIDVGTTRSGRHGAQMAALVAAESDGTGITGVAPRASVLGGSQPSEPEALARQIVEASRRGARVLNMSFSLIRPSSSGIDQISSATRFVSKTVVVVASAGNDRVNPTERVAPCSSSGVLCVGGTEAGGGFRARDSNFGSAVAIAAPFAERSAGGTSASAAIVSGVAALILETHPDWTRIWSGDVCSTV